MDGRAHREELLTALRASLEAGSLDSVKRAADSLHKVGGDPVAALSSMVLNELPESGTRSTVSITRGPQSLLNRCHHGPTKRSKSKPGQRAVRQRLRDPDSADFPFLSPSEVQISYSGDVRVKGYLHANNGIGLKVRADYLCTLQVDRQAHALSILDAQLVQR